MEKQRKTTKITMKRQFIISAAVLWVLAMVSSCFHCHWAAAVAPSEASPSKYDTQTMALLDLRSGLGIESEIWPDSADPCISWKGIACALGDGHVVSVDLSGIRRRRSSAATPGGDLRQNTITAFAPLQRLPFLQSINVSGFAISASLPAWLGSLHRLEILDFTSSQIYGDIPTSIGNLVGLRELRLSRNNLTGKIPAALFRRLANLSVVDLSQNSLTGRIPGDLSQLRRLRVLDCSLNRLRGGIPANIGALPDLETLNLSGNRFAGALPILQLLSLRRLSILDLSFNRFTGMLPAAAAVANATACVLRRLSLSHNLLYGPLTPTIVAAATANDFSNNFFDGVMGKAEAKVDFNCISGAANQRSMASCTAFYTRHGLAFQGTAADVTSVDHQTAPPKREPDAGIRRRKTRLEAIVIGVFAALAAIVGAVFIVVVVVLVTNRRDYCLECDDSSKKIAEKRHKVQLPEWLRSAGRELSLAELKQATGGFQRSSLLLSRGASGDEMYRGLLSDGTAIVVKKVDLRQPKSLRNLQRELGILLKRPHYRRLVPLVGYCFQEEDHIFLLVYKHMANGDLASLLRRRRCRKPSGDGGGEFPPLDWITRLKIATGVAEGLIYLHHGCSPPFVHSDIRANSILLDERFEARLGSLSGVTVENDVGGDDAAPPMPPSQHGAFRTTPRLLRLLRRYISSSSGHDRRQAEIGPAAAMAHSRPYDVYCFGKLLVQLITGQEEVLDHIAEEPWLETALSSLISDSLTRNSKLVDPNLILDEDLAKEVRGVAMVAKWCLDPEPARRPTMRQVLKALQNPVKVLKQINGGGVRWSSSSSSTSSWRMQSWSEMVMGGLWQNGVTMRGSEDGSGEITRRDETVVQVRRRYGGSREVFPEPEDTAAN